MGKDPGEIREEIEETRARMGDTVEAIGYKTDVKGRARGFVSDKKDAIVGKKDAIVGKKGDVTSRVGERLPDAGAAREKAQRVGGMAQQNPLGLGIAGAALGFLAGLFAPSTRVEDERIGTVADDLKERVKETGQEAFERGKQVAQEAGQTAMETAKERGQEHGQELASSAKESAQDVKESAKQKTGSGGTTGGTTPPPDVGSSKIS